MPSGPHTENARGTSTLIPRHLHTATTERANSPTLWRPKGYALIYYGRISGVRVQCSLDRERAHLCADVVDDLNEPAAHAKYVVLRKIKFPTMRERFSI